MDADKLAFFEDEQEAEAPEAEQPEAEAKEPEQPEAESKGEPEAAPPAASEEKQSGQVPLVALLEEREKRQKIEREFEELRRWRAQQEAQRQKPDFFENPEAALSQAQQQMQQQMVAERLRTSRFLAEREFGADLVKEAYAYFDQHPDQSQALINEPSPFHAAVEHYKRQKLLSEVGTDPEAYQARLREQIRKELEAELAQRAPQKPAAPPRSIASAPSAGGETTSPGSAFDELFPG
jgi:hypothetical protein